MPQLTLPKLQNLLDAIDARDRELRERIAEERERANTDGYLQLTSAVGDDADQAFAKIRAGIENEMIDRHLNELRSLEAARARIDEGIFGVCVDCEMDIDYERLLVQPAASRCAECQALH